MPTLVYQVVHACVGYNRTHLCCKTIKINILNMSLNYAAIINVFLQDIHKSLLNSNLNFTDNVSKDLQVRDA